MSNQMSVTIKDVSKDAKVSIKTVSRVINNEINVSEDTKHRVLQSILKLGFKPNKNAQSLRSKRSYMIALLYDNPNKHYLADIQSGILQVCKETGYNLVLQECNYQNKNLGTEIIEFIRDFQIDGLIVTPPLSDMDDLLTSLDNAKVHYSIIAPSDKRTSSSYVSSNDYDATYAMTNEIINKGHTNIGFIKGHHKHSASLLRYQGFLQNSEQVMHPTTVFLSFHPVQYQRASQRRQLQTQQHQQAINFVPLSASLELFALDVRQHRLELVHLPAQ